MEEKDLFPPLPPDGPGFLPHLTQRRHKKRTAKQPLEGLQSLLTIGLTGLRIALINEILTIKAYAIF